MLLFLQCLAGCALLTAIILPAQYKDPLKMIASYPPEVIRRVEQLPQYRDTIKEREKAHLTKKLVGLAFFVLVFAAVAYLSGCRSFAEAFVHVFVIFFSVNLFDLLVLDWGVFCHSRKLRISGTEDMDEVYRGWLFHVRGAVIGTALGLIVALLSGGIVQLAGVI